MTQFLNKLKIDNKEMQIYERHFYDVYQTPLAVNANTITTVTTLEIKFPGLYVVSFAAHFDPGNLASGRLVSAELRQVFPGNISRGLQSQRAENQWSVTLRGTSSLYCDVAASRFELQVYTELACNVGGGISAEWFGAIPT